MFKKTILDLGCGTGGTLEPYYKNGYSVVGLDIDGENIKECKRKMPNGRWQVIDLTEADISQIGEVDKIICTEVLEHIADWQKVLDSLENVRSGTELYITVPIETSERKLQTIRLNYWNEIGHCNFFNGPEIKEYLEKTGWQDIKIKRHNAALYFELKMLFKRNAKCIRGTYYENNLSLPIKIFFQLFRADLFQTKLKYIPIWLITLPLARILDYFWGAGIVIKAYKK